MADIIENRLVKARKPRKCQGLQLLLNSDLVFNDLPFSQKRILARNKNGIQKGDYYYRRSIADGGHIYRYCVLPEIDVLIQDLNLYEE